MRDTGIALIIIGIVAVIYFQIGFDTSVSVDYKKSGYSKPDGFPDRVNNLGLMQDKQNYTIISLAIALFGIILFVKGKKNKTDEEKDEEIVEDDIDETKEEPIDESSFFCKKCGTLQELDYLEMKNKEFCCSNCKTLNKI